MQMIVLDQLVPTHAPRMVEVSSGTLAFAQHGFSDADSIYVTTDSARRFASAVLPVRIWSSLSDGAGTSP